MEPYRTNKLNQSILEVLSQLLQVSVKDPRVGFVTLKGVKLWIITEATNDNGKRAATTLLLPSEY